MVWKDDHPLHASPPVHLRSASSSFSFWCPDQCRSGNVIATSLSTKMYKLSGLCFLLIPWQEQQTWLTTKWHIFLIKQTPANTTHQKLEHKSCCKFHCCIKPPQEFLPVDRTALHLYCWVEHCIWKTDPKWSSQSCPNRSKLCSTKVKKHYVVAILTPSSIVLKGNKKEYKYIQYLKGREFQIKQLFSIFSSMS